MNGKERGKTHVIEANHGAGVLLGLWRCVGAVRFSDADRNSLGRFGASRSLGDEFPAACRTRGLPARYSPKRVSRATGTIATPDDGVVLGLFGAEPSALGAAEDTVGRGSMHRDADSETHDDEDEELPPPLDIPLFAVEKVLAVRPRSKDADGEVQRLSLIHI